MLHHDQQEALRGPLDGAAEEVRELNEGAFASLGELAAFAEGVVVELPDVGVASQESGATDRSKEVFRLQRNPDTYEVTVDSDVTLDDYRNKMPTWQWDMLHEQAAALQGKSVSFINPTMEGGGVAMMRPPLVYMLRMLGVDAHWYVMDDRKASGKPSPFLFTKTMHNVTQRRLAARISDDVEGMATHQQWNDENFAVLKDQEPIKAGDFVVIDDPQPLPLVRQIRALNPDAKIVWRNHIDNRADLMADPATPQGDLWQYWKDCGVLEVDAAVFHPDVADNFVPAELFDRTYLAPATIEPHDDMNRLLTLEERAEGIRAVNAEIEEENRVFAEQGRLDDMQELVDPNRDRIVLIARFDPSKGMDKMMDFGVLVRQRVMEKRAAAGITDKEAPQTIIVGNGSVDDPDGIPVLEQMRSMRRTRHADVKGDIILKRLRHNYMAINALMYNDSDDAVLVGAQMSDAEGCETRITDWVNHGIPVVVANRGGMPLQVVDGKSGLVLDFDSPDFDFERGAEIVSELMVNPDMYRAMRETTFEASRNFNAVEYSTSANAIRWLRVLNGVEVGRQPDRAWKTAEMTAATEAA